MVIFFTNLTSIKQHIKKLIKNINDYKLLTSMIKRYTGAIEKTIL